MILFTVTESNEKHIELRAEVDIDVVSFCAAYIGNGKTFVMVSGIVGDTYEIEVSAMVVEKGDTIHMARTANGRIMN